MPLQNRVSPDGEIVATAARGLMYGNRGGCFHRLDGSLLERRFATRQWICCVLEFKNRRRKLLQPGQFTELFFLDEATALAAGHRPCFECRRADAVRFAERWNAVAGTPGRAAAPDMDARLHGERLDHDGAKITHRSRLSALPDGAMIRQDGGAALVFGGRLWPWRFSGYARPVLCAPRAIVDVLTPASTVAVIAAGYRPGVHPSCTDHHGAPA